MAKYLHLPRVAANFPSAPDTSELSITGDIDIRYRIAQSNLDTANGENFVSKYTTTGNQRSYQAYHVSGTSKISFGWSEDGTLILTEHSSVTLGSVGILDDQIYWGRVTMDVDNGSSDADIKFWYSADLTNDPLAVTWTQLGTTQNNGSTTSINDSTAVQRVGHHTTSSSPLLAQVFRATVLDGIGGTVVFDADFTNLSKADVEAGTFTEDSSNAATVTLNGDEWTYVETVTAGVLGRAEALYQASDLYAEGSPKWPDRSGNDHHAQHGSAGGADTNDPKFLPYSGTQYLYTT